MRNALVVGGSGGIGRAIALDLCGRQPTRVLLAYSSDDAAAERARVMLTAAGHEASTVKADVATETGPRQLAERVQSTFDNRLDVLVYSAAYRTLYPALEMPAAEWRRSLDVTLSGFVACVNELAPFMPPGGRVLAISGLSGLRAISELHLAMGSAKAGLHHAVRYLAAVLAPKGVNVNCLCLGAVLTEGVAEDLSAEQYERFIASARERSPKGAVPEPAIVASIAGFLCSPESEWIVGQVLVADGGETLR